MNAAKDDANQLNTQNIRGTMHPFYLPPNNSQDNNQRPGEDFMRGEEKDPE
jgi:hypothetical protein